MPAEVRMMDLKINPLTMEETVSLIKEKLEGKASHRCLPVYTPNAEIFMQAHRDENFRHILNSSWLTLPDGAGLKLASRLLPEMERFPARVAGCDLLQQMIAESARSNYSLYFLGARPGVAAEAAHRMQVKWPDLNIAGCHHGYLDRVSVGGLMERINEKRPDLLFVGMGAPRQEKFIHTHRERLQAGVAITVGGSFDVLSGEVKRAPVIMQELYLEWLYRLIKDPSRWRRMLRLPAFVGTVFAEILRELL